MIGRTLLVLAFASLRNRAGSVLLMVLTLALSTMLFVGLVKLSNSMRTSFEATLSETDLIIGARTAPVNLLLASVFRIGNAPANISALTAQELAGHPDFAWTVPLSLGDSHRGFRVLGTTAAYFEHYRYGRARRLALAQGQIFAGHGDVVLGAEVARTLGYGLGEGVVLTHGLGQSGIADHDDHTFRVTGILRPTGTPVDQTIHVSLEAIAEIHGGSAEATSISALLVGLKTPTSVLRVKHEIDATQDEALLAVLPGQALTELWSITGLAERLLKFVSGLLVVVGLVCALTSLLTSLAARRRELAVLRAVGARAWQIGSLLVFETLLIGFAGAVLGIAFVQLGVWFGAGLVEARWGVNLIGMGPGLVDVLALCFVTGAAGLAGLIPAVLAYRRTLIDGLSVRL